MSIRPQVISYNSPFLDIESSVYNMVASMCMTCTIPYSSVTVRRFPVFAPNDYFFENYQKEGEDKVKTYMRVIRDIMAEHGNKKLSNTHVEDKFKYKDFIYRNDFKMQGKSSD